MFNSIVSLAFGQELLLRQVDLVIDLLSYQCRVVVVVYLKFRKGADGSHDTDEYQSFLKLTYYPRVKSPIQYTPTTTDSCNSVNSRKSLTPSQGYASIGAARSASSRSRNRGMKNSLVRVVSMTWPVSP